MADENDGADARKAPQTPEELMASIDARFRKMETLLQHQNAAAASGNRSTTDFVLSFFSSGFFFLILGAALLFLAQERMSTNHAGITFVLVVLGVALLLYGTGTQGMGSGTAAGYNIAVAGGAGVVAFIVAYGIIQYSTAMRDAFQPERKFVRVLVQGGDGLTDITQYAGTFEIDGVPVPSARKGRNLEVYVPYLPYDIVKNLDPPTVQAPASDDEGMCPTKDNRDKLAALDQRAVSKMISARFYRVEAGSNLDTLLAQADTQFRVRLDQSIFRSNDGGFDYPVYPVRVCVNLQQVDRAKELIATAQKREIVDPSKSKLSTNLPPALLEAQ